MATINNLYIDQGTTYNVIFSVTDKSGIARNLANCTGRSQLRKSYYTTTNTSFTVSISTPASGNIELSLSADQTASLKAGRYVYDLEIINNTSNVVERIVEGIVVINPEVTK